MSPRVGGRQWALQQRGRGEGGGREGPQAWLKAYRRSWRMYARDSLQEDCPGQREQPLQRP